MIVGAHEVTHPRRLQRSMESAAAGVGNAYQKLFE